MTINRIFLLQTEVGHPDPWDDTINLANTGIAPSLGNTNNSQDFENKIHFFQRSDNRFSIARSTRPNAHIVLRRPYSVNGAVNEIPINFNDIANLLDNNAWVRNKGATKVLLFGSILNKNAPVTQQEVIASSSYYIRNNEKIINLITGEEHDNPVMIPWFFCYKTDELSLYYMVLNPHSIQCIESVEGIYDQNSVHTIANHLKNLNHIIFKPKFSRNTRVIGDHNLIVKGHEFTVKPFGTWFVEAHCPNFFDTAKVKVDTNFNYTWGEHNTLKVNTLGKTKGYLILRWNTATGMDLIFHVSKNRFFSDYVVDIIE